MSTSLIGRMLLFGSLALHTPSILGQVFPSTDVIEELVVVGSKIERPLHQVAGQVTLLNRDELNSLQWQELSELARYQPALEAEFAGNRFGGTGISIRGIGGNRIAMEADGVPMPQHFSVGEFANTSRTLVDPNVTGRIEVLRGPASSLYGSDAIGGVVSITSVDPMDLTEVSGASYVGGGANYRGSDQGIGAYLSYAATGNRQGGLFSVSQRHNSELDSHVDGGSADSLDAQTTAAMAKWTYTADDSLTLRAMADWYRRDAVTDLRTVLGYGRQYARTLALEGDDYQERSKLSLDMSHQPSGFVDQMTLQVFYQDNETFQQTRDSRGNLEPTEIIERQFSFSEKQLGLEAMLHKEISTESGSHILVAGFEWEQDQLREFRDGLVTDLIAGTTSKRLPPGEILPQRDLPETDVQTLGFYLQDEVQRGRWTLIPGIRWDSFKLDAANDALIADPDRLTDLEDDSVSARLGITFKINDSLTAFSHFAQGFRAPPPEDVNLYLNYSGFINVRALPNAQLRPEKSRNYELGLRYRSKDLAFTMSGYHTRFRDFIESRERVGVDPLDGALLFQSRNVASAEIEGVEFEFKQELAAWSSSLRHWSWSLAYHAARGKNADNGLPINEVSPAKTVAGITWQPAGYLSAGLFAVRYKSQTRTDQTRGEFFVPPAATVLDANAHWSPRPFISIHVGIYNLTDRQYWRYNDARFFEPNDPRLEALARPGRNLSISVHLKR